MKELLKPLLDIIVLLFVIIVVGGSFYMLSYSLQPSHNKGRNEAYIWKLIKHRCPDDSLWLDSLRVSHALSDTLAIGADGKLMGQTEFIKCIKANYVMCRYSRRTLSLAKE